MILGLAIASTPIPCLPIYYIMVYEALVPTIIFILG